MNWRETVINSIISSISNSIFGKITNFIISCIKKLIKKLREPQIYGAPVVGKRIPLFGYTKIGTIKYAGVKWQIKAPVPSPTLPFLDPSQPSLSSIEVGLPPLCPNCQTELEESKRRILPGYTWRCVNCGFTKNNRNSFYQEKDRVKRIARSEIEKQIGEK